MTELAEHTCTHDELELSSKGKGSHLKSMGVTQISGFDNQTDVFDIQWDEKNKEKFNSQESVIFG